MLSTRRQLELLQGLQQAAKERAEAEIVIAEQFAAAQAAAEKAFHHAQRTLQRDFARQIADTEQQYADVRKDIDARHETGTNEARQSEAAQRKRIIGRCSDLVETARQRAEDLKFQALSVYDARKDEPQERLDAARKKLQQTKLTLDGLRNDALTLQTQRGLRSTVGQAAGDAKPEAADENARHSGPPSREKLDELVEGLVRDVVSLRDHRLSQWFLGRGKQIGWIAGWALLGVVVGLGATFQAWGAAAGALLGAAFGAAGLAALAPRGKHSAETLFTRIERTISEADGLRRRAGVEAQRDSQTLQEEIVAIRDAEVTNASRQLQRAQAEADLLRKKEVHVLQETHEQELARLKSEHDAELAAAGKKYEPLLTSLAADRDAKLQQNQETYQSQLATAESQRSDAHASAAGAWHQAAREVRDELDQMNRRCDELFPDWNVADWDDWTRPLNPPEAVKFGTLALPLQSVKHAVSSDPAMRSDVVDLEIPALVSFAEQPRLALTCRETGRREAVSVLQSTVLRLLTALPAGKLRLTLIDPAGLGENFGALMNLNDYDEQIIGGKIWTDAKQIDDRLARLSDHMEKVLQKYLRNEFETIQQYNEHAGEVAEPYHLVVVANFPAGFNEASASKLASISASGPRCGVYVLLSIDDQLRLPHEFNPQRLTGDAVHLVWKNDRFIWDRPLYDKLQLSLDAPPQRDRMNAVLAAAGKESRESSRVEVPFEFVAPAREQIWTSDSGKELVVPIGRAGATDRQALRLGKGTSQHVLISGKTGSGKSTLLHALITNLALHYPPDQVEFYLVDFKKGVEFKSYATGQLPHARVIAIESEREFGVSVLERLDQELRLRGELFRDAGVQDLASFRRAVPNRPMPRTLLIVDEFQELFVSDDRLAQDAALLLDRLVRQGRAFGIHVLLGSQTLSGAYSLARSTLGQMAVRIALECSEADAHLILSDDNTAARLLNRPGEAIYNDENGLVAGNSPFQVVWLPDEQRREYLADLASRSSPNHTDDEPTIVFEGNVPADPLLNSALLEAAA
ncbi:MAG: hypothetical protein KDA61_01190, partial [Planctomycetales bacterium]|nr:hypothetical protein [Planctomycetales bacterium]